MGTTDRRSSARGRKGMLTSDGWIGTQYLQVGHLLGQIRQKTMNFRVILMPVEIEQERGAPRFATQWPRFKTVQRQLTANQGFQQSLQRSRVAYDFQEDRCPVPAGRLGAGLADDEIPDQKTDFRANFKGGFGQKFKAALESPPRCVRDRQHTIVSPTLFQIVEYPGHFFPGHKFSHRPEAIQGGLMGL